MRHHSYFEYFALFLLFSIVMVETFCLRDREKALFSESGGTMESDLSACVHLAYTCTLSFFLPIATSEDPSTSASFLIHIISDPS